jgi:hypothetical protein
MTPGVVDPTWKNTNTGTVGSSGLLLAAGIRVWGTRQSGNCSSEHSLFIHERILGLSWAARCRSTLDHECVSPRTDNRRDRHCKSTNCDCSLCTALTFTLSLHPPTIHHIMGRNSKPNDIFSLTPPNPLPRSKKANSTPQNK